MYRVIFSEAQLQYCENVRIEMRDSLRLTADQVVGTIACSRVDKAVSDPFRCLHATKKMSIPSMADERKCYTSPKSLQQDRMPPLRLHH
jgi:hypothetical protein